MERKEKRSFLLVMVLIFSMIFSTVTPMAMTTSKAYAEDGAKAENVSIKLQRYNYGDGVGITPKWVELHAEHQFAGKYEEIKNRSEYGVRAVVSGSDAHVEWAIEEGADFIKRAEKENSKSNEYFFNVTGTGHVKLVAKCQGATNYVEFDVVDKSKEKDELLASWKKGHGEYTDEEKPDSWAFEPDLDIPSSGLVLNVGDEICVYLHGRTKEAISEHRIGGYKLEGLDISVDTEGDKDIVQMSNGKDNYYKQDRNYLYNMTALKPGKALLKFKVGGWIKTEYKLNIPVEVRGEEPAVETKLEKVEFHKKGRNYKTSSQAYKQLEGDLSMVPGQVAYLKPVLKEGVTEKVSLKEAQSGKNVEIKDAGNGIFTAKTDKEGEFIMDVLVGENVEKQIKIVSKKQSPVLHMKEMKYVQHGPTFEWQMQYKKLDTFSADKKIIEEHIGNIRYLEADIPEVQEAYNYTFKVDDPKGVIDTRELTKASFTDKGLQYRVLNAGEAKVTVSCIGGEQEYIIRVNSAPAEKVEITNAPDILDIENSLQLKARVTPSDSTDKLKWSVDNKDICKISETGVLTPVKEGKVKVTATVGKVKAEATIILKKTSATDIYFKDNETGKKTYVKDGKITLKMTDAGKFFMVGQDDNSVTVKKWYAEEYVYHTEANESSYWFWIDQTNRFHPRKVGQKPVRLTYEMGGNTFTKDFTLEVISGNVEEIKAYAIRDNKEVEVGGEPLPVEGSERVKVILKGRNKGEKDFNVLPETSYELVYKRKQHIIGSTFALWSPETHTIDIRMLDDTAKLSFKATSSYVPQTGMEGDVPERWPIHDWNANGDKFNGMRHYTAEQVKDWGFSGFTLRTLPYNASYCEVKWKSLTPEIAEFDPLHANGLVPKKQGKAKFIAYLSENENINREVEVEFYYLHPLKEAKVKEKEIKLNVKDTKNLEIDTVPKNASEQRFVWTYSKEGIVEVLDKVNTDPTDVNVDKWTTHSVRGIKDGTVEVTGTPMDSTSGAKPVKFTVVVGKGNPVGEKTEVKFTGNGAADVEGENPKYANPGEKLSFKINKAEYFKYEVSVDDKKLEANSEGLYEIAGEKISDKPISVTVDKTFDKEAVDKKVEELEKAKEAAEAAKKAAEELAKELKKKLEEAQNNNQAVKRVYGEDRYATSLKTADAFKSALNIDKFENVVIANGDDFADALSATYLAKVKKAPIILTNNESANEIGEYLSNNTTENTNVYVIGGEKAVSTKAVKMIPGKVKRLHGTTRFDTNIAVLKEAGVSDEDVAICYAYNFADALSVSAAGVPVLLVDEALNETQKEELASLKSKKYFLIGGKQAVSDKVESEVSKYGNTERIAGNNRFETSRAIAERFFSGEQEKVYLTYGYNFPDGLCAGALCAAKGNPLLLVSNENMAEAKSYIEKAKVKSCVVLGSEKLISDKAVMSILKK